MKPMFEKIVNIPNTSWRFWLYQVEQLEFNWHYHPEYEIALTLNSSGQRFVGDHNSSFQIADMVCIGPNLPHTWSATQFDTKQPIKVFVIQIPAAWFESLIFSIPELAVLKSLIHSAKLGLRFSNTTIEQCSALFESMDASPTDEHFVQLMSMLNIMAKDAQAKTLASANYNSTLGPDPYSVKLDKIINYIHDNFSKSLKAEQVAQIVNMSTNHFHRFLKQRTEQTFTGLINQLRVNKACNMLTKTKEPIAIISKEAGFNNISNFNRRFMQHQQMSPSQYRKLKSINL